MAKLTSKDVIDISGRRAAGAIDEFIGKCGTSADLQLQAISGIKTFLDKFESGDPYQNAPQDVRDALRIGRDALARIGLDMVFQVWATRNGKTVDQAVSGEGLSWSGVCDGTRGGG